ncbi:unnamed protein product [Staurois parvus]|uniref:Uncharacterized protein n=1 Tax=Staurois parvus TaxID=386267 RepID=A0ABN9ACN2_9NEOB|nr:unnamed protein product [Staurois parvus]
MISVAPSVPPVSASSHQCQCPSVPHQYHKSVHTSMHINATYQCPPKLRISAHQ